MDNFDVWNQLIQKIKSYPGVNPSQIDAFFSRLQIQAVSPGYILISTTNGFMKDWVERHHKKNIQRALEEIYNVEFEVDIAIDPTAEENSEVPSIAQAPTVENTAVVSEVINVSPVQKPIQEPGALTATTSEPIVEQPSAPTADNATSRLNFNSFVIGPSNSMAYHMAVEVAERPGSSALNPLFIYGRSGVGKTHLMCAIRNYINEQYPNLNVIYIDSMELVNRYSDAAREKSIDKSSFKNFENFFKEADVLLVDDVQSLQGKSGTLDALFRIFNTNINQGKQFVFSADRAPKNIDMDERYLTRFNSGATIDIQPAEDELKRSIIKNFLQQYKNEEGFDYVLSDEIIDYIIEHSSPNIRELKSAITNVIFAMKMSGEQELNTQDVKDLLANHFINEAGNRLTIDQIKAAVSDFYHISQSDLESKSRSHAIVYPRHVAVYLSRTMTDATFQDIAKAFNRNHSTTMHSYDVIEFDLQSDRNLREEIEAIRKKLRTQEY